MNRIKPGPTYHHRLRHICLHDDDGAFLKENFDQGRVIFVSAMPEIRSETQGRELTLDKKTILHSYQSD
jgi:hypothetical protein